jgi:hypothetical protein
MRYIRFEALLVSESHRLARERFVFRQSIAKFFQMALSLMLAVPAFAAAPVPSRPEAIAFLTGLKAQNTVRLQDTDKAILKKLDETRDTRLLDNVHAEIEKLRTEKRELMLRQEFLDRLILQFDTKYEGTAPRDFLEGALKKMAQVEIESTSATTIWPFLDNLRRLISKLPDQQDRVLNLVEGYMKQTSMSNPMHPDEFMKNIAYSNGSQTEGAKPMDRALVGEYTDRKLKEIASINSNRLKVPALPPEAPAAAPTAPPAAESATKNAPGEISSPATTATPPAPATPAAPPAADKTAN